ncbi:MAG: nitroreductase family protein [Neisseria sp.]|nr:nitroreductase family protein [Neisseria sp.]
MNQIIELITSHRTYRHFDENHTLSAEEVAAILAAAQQAPSWMNGQHYSIIRLTDRTLRAEFGALFPANPQLVSASECWVFVGDLHRMKLASQAYGGSFDGAASTESTLVMSIDAALAAQNAALAAESLGYGTCFVGAMRQQVKSLIELLKLPHHTFPLFALCIGKPSIEMQRKPRLPAHVVCCENAYRADVDADLAAYEKVMTAFGEAREKFPWRDKFSRYYHQVSLPENDKIWQEQGLKKK